MVHKIETKIGDRTFAIETGRVAFQADGAVLVSFGNTIIFASAVAEHKVNVNLDFFPLLVDYRERTAAAGKIPGGFFKREGRPSEGETLAARLIDRSMRPLFPKAFRCSTQVVCFVFSADPDNDPDILAVNGASAALLISDIPFEGPVSAVRVGRIDGQFVINPTCPQMTTSDLDLVACGTREALAMVEGSAKGLPEAVICSALDFAAPYIQQLNELQLELQRLTGKSKRVIVAPEIVPKLLEQQPFGDYAGVLQQYRALLIPILENTNKVEHQLQLAQLKEQFLGHFDLTPVGVTAKLKRDFEQLIHELLRWHIVANRRRLDGRTFDEIRPITCEVDLLPRSHGSALFTRGLTQALVTTTLGTASDEQIIDDLLGESTKKFMLHYNFPAFSSGEVGPQRGPGRREVGHGALAERALQAVIPAEEGFPYTLRVVSDILSSNGSTSMATVCGASLALMDAGVPITSPVAGIAMGLIKENDDIIVLSDITGIEDHNGDMDFKVAGTKDGVTAIQMDIKVKGISHEVLEQALHQACVGRLHILDKMLAVLPQPRPSIKPHAPRILVLKINPAKIASVIGPQGKIIRSIILETGVKIDIEDDGTVKIAANDEASLAAAREKIERIIEEAVIGKVYTGTVRRVEAYGAFIEILPGLDGLLHISESANYRVREMRDICKEGDQLTVKVIDIDKMGKVRLGRRELLPPGEGQPPDRPPDDRQSSDRPPSDRYRDDRDSRDSRDRRRPPYQSDRRDSRPPSRDRRPNDGPRRPDSDSREWKPRDKDNT